MTFVRKHGLTDSIEHRAWARIRRRCYSPSYHNYPRYGGRGIEVCERWSVFENFLADMETSANQLFFVLEPADEHLAHCWNGLRVKRAKGGYVAIKNAKPVLVRKEGSRVVAQFAELKGAA